LTKGGIRISRYAAIYGSRIAAGCSLCFSGSKAVIFITGLCRESCYYCPISSARKNRDVMFVNERKTETIQEAVAEVERSGASSASITGGDPLERLDRTLQVIRALKAAFGPSFHIHLYTNGLLARDEVLRALEAAGLDEIRFHPTRREALERIRRAKELTGMSVGAEIPAIPGREGEIVALAEFLDEVNADFLNINELEVSESNESSLRIMGFSFSPDGKAVSGSAETAFKAMRTAEERGLRIPIHFCPASFKDEIQTRRRFARAAESDLRVYEKATAEGTVLYGVLKCLGEEEIGGLLEGGLLFRCGREELCFHPDDLDIVRQIARGGCMEIVEAHPTNDRLVINRETVT